MKSFVRSRIFRQIRRAYGDARALDAIFVRAMQMTNNNTAVSLLLSTIATFDHRDVGLKVPVFSLYVPLSNESEEEFSRRVANLPSQLYVDSPENSSGDRDKLQHFLGSAFLAFTFESGGVATRVGEFVEQGEEAFIIGGVNDDRDRRADEQGGKYGAALLEDTHRLPSEFLTSSSDEGLSAVPPSSCPGAW